MSFDATISNKPSCSRMKGEAMDENCNYTETMEQPGTPSSELSTLLPIITNLKIESPPASLYQAFGKVENVIAAIRLALVQSTSSTVILDIDTPVFIVLPPAPLADDDPEFVLLGEIDDIFGSIGKPMYSVRLTRDILAKSSLVINSFVYLLPTHPNTNTLRVERVGGKKYNVVAEERGVCR